MAELTIQRRYQYGDPSKGQPTESLKHDCRKIYLKLFPWDIHNFSVVTNIKLQ